MVYGILAPAWLSHDIIPYEKISSDWCMTVWAILGQTKHMPPFILHIIGPICSGTLKSHISLGVLTVKRINCRLLNLLDCCIHYLYLTKEGIVWLSILLALCHQTMDSILSAQ